MSDDIEIPLDIKNDIELAFNLYKNENNKINKLKLRTILFSFVMYKFSASDINDFIESRTLKEKELYSFDDLCDLVKEKLLESKERDADELYNYILNRNDIKKDKNKNTNKDLNSNNKTENARCLTKNGLINAFKSATIDINIDEKDIDKMLEYMKRKQNDESDRKENQETVRQDSEKLDKSEDGKQSSEKGSDREKEQKKEIIKISREQFKEFYVEQK